MAKKKSEVFQPSGDVKRIISLNNGNHAYIIDHLGKVHHVARNSDRFNELISILDENLDGRGSRDLERLGWK
jgi:hypothetical protein